MSAISCLVSRHRRSPSSVPRACRRLAVWFRDHLASSPPCRAGDVAGAVVERGGAVAVGSRRSGHAAHGIVKGRHAVAIGAGAAGDATVRVVEGALLRLGGREREQQKRDCDADHEKDWAAPPSIGENWPRTYA